MHTIRCGIDEAGYGPMLGPLCVAAAAFRVPDPRQPARHPAPPSPDLWATLDKAVCRDPRDPRGRIPIADSKRLKRPNSVKRGHPLEHLERGVLACLPELPLTDAALLDILGARLPDTPCYQRTPNPLPLGRDAASLRIDAARIATAMHRAGIEPVGIRCVVIGERTFNDAVRAARTKARATALGIVPLARWADRRARAAGDRLELICDQQSGRTDDTPLLAECFPDAPVEPAPHNDGARTYTIGPNRAATVMPEAEDRHLPVALASMTAKLVRELAMLRFNAYWTARIPELKPTAGYVTDARRWLRDAEHAITPDERAALVRIA